MYNAWSRNHNSDDKGDTCFYFDWLNHLKQQSTVDCRPWEAKTVMQKLGSRYLFTVKVFEGRILRTYFLAWQWAWCSDYLGVSQSQRFTLKVMFICFDARIIWIKEEREPAKPAVCGTTNPKPPRPDGSLPKMSCMPESVRDSLEKVKFGEMEWDLDRRRGLGLYGVDVLSGLLFWIQRTRRLTVFWEGSKKYCVATALWHMFASLCVEGGAERILIWKNIVRLNIPRILQVPALDSQVGPLTCAKLRQVRWPLLSVGSQEKPFLICLTKWSFNNWKRFAEALPSRFCWNTICLNTTLNIRWRIGIKHRIGHKKVYVRFTFTRIFHQTSLGAALDLVAELYMDFLWPHNSTTFKRSKG